MLRFFEILLSLFLLVVLLPLIVLIFLLALKDSKRPIFAQQRVGQNKSTFTLFKFRTMDINTASVASHLANSSSITPLGRILRATKLDELPQIWNVLIGDMSFVGPRPNLPNQKELIKERELCGVYKVRPGITGLAQVKKIDMSNPILLAKTDKIMIETLTLQNYFKYMLLTVLGKGGGDRVK